MRRAWEYLCYLLPDAMAFGFILFIGVYYHIIGALFLGGMAAMFLMWLRQFLAIRQIEQLLILLRQNRKELKRKNEELLQKNSLAVRDASLDFLTQLYNRRTIDRALNRPKEFEDGLIHVGLLLIDVDFFKQVNDKLGHAAGDKVLQQVANSIRSALTEAAIGGRFGGDEFIVILYDESEEIVSVTASRIQEYVWSDAYLSQIPVTLSIGGAAWQGNITEYDPKSLLGRADAALYQSKARGRDRYTFLPMEI